MNTKPQASVIVTSYNQRRTLEFTLMSLHRQTQQDFEIIIADDGSSDQTAKFCQSQKDVVFITQPDMGYRKAKILNKALKAAQSDYLIFLDADVIVEKHFIEDHLRLRKPGHFVCGRRVELGPRFSESISADQVLSGQFDQWNWRLFFSVMKKDSRHFNRSRRMVQPWLRKLFKYDAPLDILGSNFSAWRDDVLDVNGFNEALESYWGEDGDLFVRLRNSGRKAIGAKALCVQFHVYHTRREPTPENVERHYRLLMNHDYRKAQQGYAEQSQE